MNPPSDEFEPVEEPGIPIKLPPAPLEPTEVRVLKPTRKRRGFAKKVSDVADAIGMALALAVSKIKQDPGARGGDWMGDAPVFGEKELKIDYDARLEKMGLPVEMSAAGYEYVVINRKPVALRPQGGREVSLKNVKLQTVMTEDGPRELAPWIDLTRNKPVLETVWKDPRDGKIRRLVERPAHSRLNSYDIRWTENGQQYVVPLLVRPYEDEPGAVPDETKARVYLGMGDKVTCKAILRAAEARGGPEYLFLDTADSDFREIPVRPKGEERRTSGPEWEYAVVKDEKGNDLLQLEPSLLCSDSGFHTDYTWRCQFVRCPEGQHSLDVFLTENPGCAWAKARAAEQGNG